MKSYYSKDIDRFFYKADDFIAEYSLSLHEKGFDKPKRQKDGLTGVIDKLNMIVGINATRTRLEKVQGRYNPWSYSVDPLRSAIARLELKPDCDYQKEVATPTSSPRPINPHNYQELIKAADRQTEAINNLVAELREWRNSLPCEILQQQQNYLARVATIAANKAIEDYTNPRAKAEHERI